MVVIFYRHGYVLVEALVEECHLLPALLLERAAVDEIPVHPRIFPEWGDSLVLKIPLFPHHQLSMAAVGTVLLEVEAET